MGVPGGMQTHRQKMTTTKKGIGGAEVPLPVERAFVVQFRAETHFGRNLFVGRAEHIASGDTTRFGSVEELTAFIAKVLAPQRSP
jgi:hypothetical protein